MLKFYLLVYHPASLFLQTPTTCYKRKMHDTQQRFMSKLAGRFIEAEVIWAHIYFVVATCLVFSIIFEDVETMMSSSTLIHSKLTEEPAFLNNVEKIINKLAIILDERENLLKNLQKLKLIKHLFEWMLFVNSSKKYDLLIFAMLECLFLSSHVAIQVKISRHSWMGISFQNCLW